MSVSSSHYASQLSPGMLVKVGVIRLVSSNDCKDCKDRTIYQI